MTIRQHTAQPRTSKRRRLDPASVMFRKRWIGGDEQARVVVATVVNGLCTWPHKLKKIGAQWLQKVRWRDFEFFAMHPRKVGPSGQAPIPETLIISHRKQAVLHVEIIGTVNVVTYRRGNWRNVFFRLLLEDLRHELRKEGE